MAATDNLAERLTAALADAIRLVDGHTRLVDERAAAIAEQTIRDVRAAAEVRVADAEHLAQVADQLRAAAEVLVVARKSDLDRVVRDRDTAIARADDLLLQLEASRVERAALIAARNAAQARADEADAARLQLRADLDSATAGAERLLQELETAIAERDDARRGLERVSAELESARVASWSPRAHPSRPLTAEQQRASEAGEGRTDWPVWVAPCDPVVVFDGDEEQLACGQRDDATVIVALEPGRRWSELVAAVAPHRCGNTQTDKES